MLWQLRESYSEEGKQARTKWAFVFTRAYMKYTRKPRRGVSAKQRAYMNEKRNNHKQESHSLPETAMGGIFCSRATYEKVRPKTCISDSKWQRQVYGYGYWGLWAWKDGEKAVDSIWARVSESGFCRWFIKRTEWVLTDCRKRTSRL